MLPGLGIFASLDPVGPQAYLQAPNGLGPWTYANGNPLRFVDPDGRDPAEISYRQYRAIEEAEKAKAKLSAQHSTLPAMASGSTPYTAFLGCMAESDTQSSGTCWQRLQERTAYEKNLWAMVGPVAGSSATVDQTLGGMTLLPGGGELLATAAKYRGVLAGLGAPSSELASFDAFARIRADLKNAGWAANVALLLVDPLAAEASVTRMEARAGVRELDVAMQGATERLVRNQDSLGAGDLLSQSVPRSPELGAEASMADLLSAGHYPGSEGVVLTNKAVGFGDIYELSSKLRVEVSLSRELVGDTQRFVLRSGGYTRVYGAPRTAGSRTIAHTHLPALEGETARIDLPSKSDLAYADSLYEAYLRSDRRLAPPMSRVVWGPADSQHTFFWPTTR
jgi:hypothetical protein